ncbi:Cerato-ulmin hydrophobin family [Xylariaceae sp. FL0594]|nr:Cerato-ulmin hydrophobin family [Xylariaceae sp. FL0594]
MQFHHLSTTTILLVGLGLAAAMPTQEEDPYTACTGIYGTSQCCATDVLGVADLDCANPPTVPASADDFAAVCAAGGQRARCCVLPVLGQDVLCQTPAGVKE